jgi:hypothetical protein
MPTSFQNSGKIINRVRVEGFRLVLAAKPYLNLVARHVRCDQNVHLPLSCFVAADNRQLPPFLNHDARDLMHQRHEVFQDVSLDLVGHRLAAPSDTSPATFKPSRASLC